MRRISLALLTILIATTLSAQSPLRIAGISEPPELTGEPKKFRQATDAEREMLDLVGKLKDESQARAAFPALDELIQHHPDYSDAYFLRAYRQWLHPQQQGFCINEVRYRAGKSTSRCLGLQRR